MDNSPYRNFMIKYLRNCLFVLATFVMAASCKENSKHKEVKTDSLPTDSIPIPKLEPPVPNDSILISLTKKVLTLIKEKNYVSFAEYIHPVSGLRFSPYSYIDSVKDVRYSRDKFLAAVKNKKQKITWGSYDGSGDRIFLTPEEYFKEFVYDADFVNPEKLAANKMIGAGNSLNNLEGIYPGLPFTESYFSGFEKKYEGMDWRSLRLVFKKERDRYYLVAIIHDQWTI